MKTVSLRTQFSSSALPPEGTYAASPKAISRRTSYYRVRLEFLRYPQLIPLCCTASGFGPPPAFLRDSTWPWIDHPVSGRVCATDSPFQTRFPYASPRLGGVKLATHSTLAGSFFNRNTINRPDLRRGWSLALCKRMVSETISSPSPGCFSPFPRGTCSLSIIVGI